ncbi:hypothetical protein E2320_013874 [Naja naja]|nr:hypothetical protein E2320_013874 [Naja naja]
MPPQRLQQGILGLVGPAPLEARTGILREYPDVALFPPFLLPFGARGKENKMAAEVDAPVARNISHYEVLGIKQDATSKEIKQAFFRKSKQLHSQFVKLNEAYNILSKEKSRRDYDAQQTIQKTHRGFARDPFGDLHLHRQPRNQKARRQIQTPMGTMPTGRNSTKRLRSGIQTRSSRGGTNAT